MPKSPKARLSSGRRINIKSDESASAGPGLGADSPVIRTASKKSPLLPRIVKPIVGLILILTILGALIYTALAATVLVVMRADGHNAIVLRGAFPVGRAPAEAYAYVSSAPEDYTIIGKLSEATVGVPAGSIVQIVAGPSASISTDAGGKIVADGVTTKHVGKVATTNLTAQYVAICVAGACDAGEAVLVGQDNIIGGVKGYLTTSGVTPVTTPTGVSK